MLLQVITIQCTPSVIYGLWEKNVASSELLPPCDLRVLSTHAYLPEIMSSLSFDTPTLMWPWQWHFQFQVNLYIQVGSWVWNSNLAISGYN